MKLHTSKKNGLHSRNGSKMADWLLILLSVILLFPGMNAFAQPRTITGQVLQANTGDPLPGISILEKGTQNGTITDNNGNYSIRVNPSSSHLVFSFIGMKTMEIPIEGRSIIDASMEEDVIGLEEVVAIGYGSVKKSDLTGSVGSVKVEDVMKNPVTSLDQALQGRVAGVQIVQTSAQPGGSTLFRIRGASSIYAANEPLYVIDGMQVNTGSNLSWISAPEINPLSSLNPSDIESIEILKDASATSIYGAKGANGVVLITTKRGKAGRDNISFEGYYGIQEIAKRIEVMNAAQYAVLFDEAGENAAIEDGVIYDPKYPEPESLGEGTNWQDLIYRIAPTMNYQLNFSGGNDRTQYAITGGYFDQNGIIIGSDFKRYSFRTNIDRAIGNRIKVGTNITVNKTKANTVGSSTQAGFFPGVVNTSLTMAPTLPVRDSTGQYTIKDPDADAWLDNPVAVTRDRKAITNTFKFVGNVFGTLEIIEGLDLKISFGFDQYQNLQDYYNPTYTYSGSFNNGQARFSHAEFNSLLNENTLNYNTVIGDHRLNALAGFTFNKKDQRSFTEIVTGFPNDRLEYFGITDAANVPTIYTGFSEEALISYLARINYGYKQRYLATLTHRIDGSSKFGPNNRFAQFPSLALAWRISSEPFLQNVPAIYNMKLRASIGTSGNDAIPNYLYVPTLSTNEYYFNNSGPAIGYYQDRIGNNDLRWETTQQFDIGLDLALFGGRISVVTDYYNKNTFDMLYYAEVPYTSGFSTALINVGSMVNKGLEFTMNTVNLTGPFSWNTDFSISFNKNEVTDLNNNNETYISDDTYKLKIGYWSIIAIGEELGSFYGLESDGIWQLEEEAEALQYGVQPGDFKYVDQNDDQKIDEADRLILGSAQPDFFWSLNNTLSYKGFELSFYLQGVEGNDILNSNRFELESGNGKSNASIEMLDRWTPTNPSNKYPRANRNTDYLRMSDRYLEDGSYIRLQLVSVGYELPSGLTEKIGVEKARIYVSGKNLLTITDYSGFDPEVGRFGNSNIRQGYDLGGYPTAKTYLVGISLNF
jgi:TonB-dependent starch-binding outer membrane protein SusC